MASKMNHRLFGLVFALLTVGSHAEDVFSGEWDGSEHVYLRQVGNKVCGLWSTTATGRGYEGRLIGTASSNYLKVDWACGTPGARAATYCADSAPSGESNIGWSPSEEGALVCNGMFLLANKMPRSCPPLTKTATWDTRVSGAVAQPGVHTFEASEVAWADNCATTLGRDDGALAAVLKQPQPFEERFSQAKHERTPERDAYMMSLVPVFQRVGQRCLPASAYAASAPNPQVKRFRLVGTVNASQMVGDIQVDVQSDYSMCVARKLRGAPVPRPPTAPFPLAIELSYVE